MPATWRNAALQLGAQHIGSDFELRSVLSAFAPRVRDDAELQRAYLDAIEAIGSDFEAQQALVAFLRHAAPDVNTLAGVLRAAEGIGSDHDQLQVLRLVAARMPDDAQLVAQYRAIAAKMASHEREQAEAAIR